MHGGDRGALAGARDWASRYPGTTTLLAGTLVVYLLELAAAWSHGDVHRLVVEGLPVGDMERWFMFDPRSDRPLQLVASLLAHGSWDTLAVHSAFLAAFGPAVERQLGSGRHVVGFFVLGALTSLLQAGVRGGAMWGASGVVIAYAAYWPWNGYRMLAVRLGGRGSVGLTRTLRLGVVALAFLVAFPVTSPDPGISHTAHVSAWFVGTLAGGMCIPQGTGKPEGANY